MCISVVIILHVFCTAYVIGLLDIYVCIYIYIYIYIKAGTLSR